MNLPWSCGVCDCGCLATGIEKLPEQWKVVIEHQGQYIVNGFNRKMLNFSRIEKVHRWPCMRLDGLVILEMEVEGVIHEVPCR